MSDCWLPYNHRYDGSCFTSPQVLPHYPSMPEYLRVYDTAVRTNGWARWQKKAWRASRTKALARWTGLTTVVVERGLVDGDYLPEGVTLRVLNVDPNNSANFSGFGLSPLEPAWSADYSALAWSESKAFVQMHPKTVSNAWAGRNYGYLTGAMCHEFGHAFGFGHGGIGIMRSAISPPYVPSTEDLAEFKSYWGTGG